MAATDTIADQPDKPDKNPRNFRRFAGQGAISHQAWILSSPSVVMAFIAVSLELPIFLAGSLAAVHHAAGTVIDIFAFRWIRVAQNRKRAIMLADAGVALCYVAFVYSLFWDNTVAIGIAFTGLLLLIGAINEVRTLISTPFFTENLPPDKRIRVQFLQVLLGGIGAIAVVVVAHRLFDDDAALTRHALVVTVGAFSFFLAGLATLSIRDRQSGQNDPPADRKERPKFFETMRRLAGQNWYRKYLMIRLLFVMLGLSVPFYTLVTAQAHHSTAKGLTALVVSSAAAMTISAPLWRYVTGRSYRLAMICGSVMILLAGIMLILVGLGDIPRPIYYHAASVFVATAAAAGLSSARSLYFMQIVPKDELVAAMSVTKTLARFAIIGFTALLAGLAHTQDTLWTVVLIVTAAFLATITCFLFVPPDMSPSKGPSKPQG